MTRLLWDTSAYIEFTKGNFKARQLIKELGVNKCAIPHVVIAELLFGEYKINSPHNEIIRVERRLSVFELIFSTRDTCHVYAKIKAQLEKQGTP